MLLVNSRFVLLSRSKEHCITKLKEKNKIKLICVKGLFYSTIGLFAEKKLLLTSSIDSFTK